MFRPRLALLALAGTAAFTSHAWADKPVTLSLASNKPPKGYHDLKLADGRVLRVADQASPVYHGAAPASDDDKYDPSNADFSRSSAYAHKSFDTAQATLSKDTSSGGGWDQAFHTDSFSTSRYNQAGRAFQTVAFNDATRPDRDLTKGFTLPHGYTDADRSFDAGKKSDLQDKTALVAQDKPRIDPFSAPGDLTAKTFFDPTMLHVPHKEFNLSSSIRADPNSAGTITDVPNRALTVDEVRNLINHDQLPDLNAKADLPSKPLNDPEWSPPEALPPAPDNRPLKPGPTSEDKSDELPSPGMMAEPVPAPAH